MHAVAALALLPLQRSAALGPRLGWRDTAATASAASTVSQYEPPCHQRLERALQQGSRSTFVMEAEVARGGIATRLHRPRSFEFRAPIGALCMVSDREDSGGPLSESEDDLLASYRERLDAEGGATSFRLRGDATRALQEVSDGGSKALNSTKAFVDWDSTKASAAQVPPSLACSLSSLPGLPPPPARSPKRNGVSSLPRRGRAAACSTRTAGGSLS
jgi:hypothetical protein